MSDIENDILKNEPSISEQDQERIAALCSVNSVHLMYRESQQDQLSQQAAMSEENSHERQGALSPGYHKPPHHKKGKTKKSDESTFPSHVPSLQKQPSNASQTHEWSFDISEPQSPKKEPVGVLEPQVLATSPSSRPGSKKQKKDQKQGQEIFPMKSMSEGGEPSETEKSDKQAEKNALLKKDYMHSTDLNTAKGKRDDPSAEGSDGQREKDATNGQNNRDGQSIEQSSALNMSKSRYTPTVTNSTKDSLNQRHINQTAIAAYISKNMQQRECKAYARNASSTSQESPACQCGRGLEWHLLKGINTRVDSEHTIWHPKTHTKVLPCDSFGEILFRGFGSQSNNSPYVRVDYMTDMETVGTLLMDYWHLPVPKLLISITGGAKRFNLKERLSNILKQGLVTAAVSTGAWIITGGTAAGVMELVGEALHDHHLSTGNTDRSQCVALGIASWGVIANNVALDGEGDSGLFPAQYAMEDIQSHGRNRAALDHNHTHFILVDDGTDGKFGVEIEFRAKLESYISSIVETGVAKNQSIHVPSILIVVEGGVNTLQTVHASIKRKIPVVVINGSGRVADFIALAYRLTKTSVDEDKTVYPENFDKTMKQKAKVMFEWQRNDTNIDQKIVGYIRLVKECLQERKLLNVFNLDKADSVKDIDRAILYALLRANKSNANSQLALALAWNRCDIARQEIFTSVNRQHWKHIDLYPAMFTALVQNRADFVQLFLDNGLDLKRFLNIKTLWNLYCECIKEETDAGAQLLRYLITYQKQTWAAFLLCHDPPDFENFPDLLPYIGKVVADLLEDQRFHFYSDKKFVVRDNNPSLEWKKRDFAAIKRLKKAGGKFLPVKKHQKAKDEFDFESPERELFLWAILFNRSRLVRLFWKQGRDHIGGALFASALLKQLSIFADNEEEDDLSAEMATSAGACEQWAVSVLSECYSRDKQLTHHLLVRELPSWGQTTLFSMADTYEMMEFSGHSACQTKVSSIWKGRMALYTSEMKIAMCIFFPLMVPSIKFTADYKSKEEDKKKAMPGDLTESPRGSTLLNNTVSPRTLSDDNQDGKSFVPSQTRRERVYTIASKFNKVQLCDLRTADNISIFAAILYFYQAPVTKFFCNIISYFVFMGLFTYFVLVELRPVGTDSPSIFEYITWMWLGTMVLEELRQMMSKDHGSVIYRVKNWFGNVWNKFDLLIYVLFMVSIILRYLLESEFVWARIVYSITMALFYLRFMQFFYAEKNIGPKVIIIRKMLTDLSFFVAILVVFMLSFGTAYQANLFPHSVPSWTILGNVFYFPYFQMHGENFLDEMQGDPTPNCSKNQSVWENNLANRCPENNKVVPVLLGVYLMLINILLVNLLIAMFSYTFQNVQDNSLKVWRYFRLSLVFEYADRPTLVSPLIFINHVFRFLRWLCYKATKDCINQHDPLQVKLSPEDHNRLTVFERMAMENYLTHSKQMSKGSLDNQVATTAERIESIMEELEIIKDTIQQQEGQRTQLAGVPTESPSKEADIMEHVSPSAPDSKHVSREEIERLSKCVEELSARSASTSVQLADLINLLQTSVQQQQQIPSRVKSWTSPKHLQETTVIDEDEDTLQ